MLEFSVVLLLVSNLLVATSYFPAQLSILKLPRQQVRMAMTLTSINRADFPILKVDAYPNKPLVYLDSAGNPHLARDHSIHVYLSLPYIYPHKTQTQHPHRSR